MQGAMRAPDALRASGARSFLLDPRSEAVRRWDAAILSALLFTASVTPFQGAARRARTPGGRLGPRAPRASAPPRARAKR
jgi:hypothetical protein